MVKVRDDELPLYLSARIWSGIYADDKAAAVRNGFNPLARQSDALRLFVLIEKIKHEKLKAKKTRRKIKKE